MNFDYKLLGKKIKEAREGLLIETDKVANSLDLNIHDYINIENGQFTNIDGDLIIQISNLFKIDFRYFVTGNYPSAESQINELFRQNGDLSKNDRMSIQEFIRLCEKKYEIEEIIKKEKTPTRDYNSYKFSTDNHKYQGISAAYLERSRLNISGSIDDIYRLLRKQRIHIFRRKLEDSNISGIYIKHPYAGHCILVNYSDDIFRQNFSMAHEYCHALFDSNVEQIVSYIDKEMTYIEIRANNFASNFLFPKEESDKFKSYDNTNKLKQEILKNCHKFHISSKVIINRLGSEKIITDEIKKTLLADSDLIIRKLEKVDPELDKVSTNMREKLKSIIENGLSLEYIELCRNACQQHEISYGKMLECLQMPYENAKQLIDLLDISMGE